MSPMFDRKKEEKKERIEQWRQSMQAEFERLNSLALSKLAAEIAEGLQELEHASLVRAQAHTALGGLDCTTTRRGRAALQRGEVESVVRGWPVAVRIVVPCER